MQQQRRTHDQAVNIAQGGHRSQETGAQIHQGQHSPYQYAVALLVYAPKQSQNQKPYIRGITEEVAQDRKAAVVQMVEQIIVISCYQREIVMFQYFMLRLYQRMIDGDICRDIYSLIQGIPIAQGIGDDALQIFIGKLQPDFSPELEEIQLIAAEQALVGIVFNRIRQIGIEAGKIILIGISSS